MLMLAVIGAAVKRARRRRQWSLPELAAASGVPADLLEALEAGGKGLSTTALDRIADALSLDPSALLKGREVRRDRPSVFLRHAPIADFDDRDQSSLDDALEQGRLLRGLGAMLEVPAGRWRSGAFLPCDVGSDTPARPALEGYDLAHRVRSALSCPQEPLGDLREVLEVQFEIAVLVRVLESLHVTAVSVRATDGAAVVLNHGDSERAHNPLLARVHLCHELCHVLFDRSEGGLHIVVDEEADRKPLLAEKRARAFAAELLLPRSGLVSLLGEPRAVSDPAGALDLIARARCRFATPHEIAANHLHNHGFTDPALRERLVAAKTPWRGESPPTSLPSYDEPSRLLRERVRLAHEAERITDGEARAALGVDVLAPLPWDVLER